MSALTTFSNWLVEGCHALLAAIPANCSLCSQVSAGASLCPPCIDSLPYTTHVCQRCGLSLTMASEDKECGYCAVYEPQVERSLSLLRYEPPADRLISGFKYRGRFADGKTLAILLAERIREQYGRDELPELLIPVPLHLSRWRQRGYNQALELSKTVSKRCGIRVAPRLLVRTKQTLPQTEMTSAAARRRNLARAFTVPDPGLISGISRVAIMDDVITTLATANSAAAALRLAGVREVHAWSLARALR